MFYGEYVIYNLSYIFVFLFMAIKNIQRGNNIKNQIYVVAIFAGIMVIEITFNTISLFSVNETNNLFSFSNIFCTIFIFLPFMIEQFIVVKNDDFYNFPSMNDPNVISYKDSITYKDQIVNAIDNLKKIKEKVTYEDIIEIIKDLPKHNSFKYINKDSLSPEYFKRVNETLNDENIYIVLSNTGSTASEIISVFTKKIYNHVSISFDSDLDTIISYNGGERLYSPGLNPEMLEWFNKKDDASIMVYRLNVSREVKQIIINKISDINNEGSAYNMLGLILKLSFKPNILFCSQFIYKLFEYADINYFEKNDGQVKPTDLVELDYYRKLQFISEIDFNSEKPKLIQEAKLL